MDAQIIKKRLFFSDIKPKSKLNTGILMKLISTTIWLTLLLLSNANAGTPVQYEASKLFSKNDARALVDTYYELHDKRAKAEAYYPLLADKDLYMIMGSTVESKKEFKSWLRKIKIFSKSVEHTVKQIDISVQDNGSFFVNLCVRYKGKTRFFTKFDNLDRIKWEMVESKDESRLVIKTYLVESGCK